MAIKIRPLRSTTPGTIPTWGTPEDYGELAVNLADRRMYMADELGNPVALGEQGSWTMQDADFLAAGGGNYVVDAGLTVLLPAVPESGFAIRIADPAATYEANPITLDGNGFDVGGGITAQIDWDGADTILVFNGVEWLVIDDFQYHKLFAANIDNTPSGDIAATNVQAAINELDVEKATPAYVDAQDVITLGNAADYTDAEVANLAGGDGADILPTAFADHIPGSYAVIGGQGVGGSTNSVSWGNLGTHYLVLKPGIMSMHMELSVTAPGAFATGAYAQIYIDGVAVGALRSVTAAPDFPNWTASLSVTEDLPVNEGSIIELRARSSEVASTCQAHLTLREGSPTGIGVTTLS